MKRYDHAKISRPYRFMVLCCQSLKTPRNTVRARPSPRRGGGEGGRAGGRVWVCGAGRGREGGRDGRSEGQGPEGRRDGGTEGRRDGGREGGARRGEGR